MKKARKTRLHLDRDVLRLLQTYELRDVAAGGGTIVRPFPPTTDSEVACCA
jgi:hypothetical protein